MHATSNNLSQNFTGFHRILVDKQGFQEFGTKILPKILENKNCDKVIVAGNPVFRETFKSALDKAAQLSNYNKSWVLKNAEKYGVSVAKDKQYIWIFSGKDIKLMEEYINKRFMSFKKCVQNERKKLLLDFKMPDYHKDLAAVVKALDKEFKIFMEFAQQNGVKDITPIEALTIRS